MTNPYLIPSQPDTGPQKASPRITPSNETKRPAPVFRGAIRSCISYLEVWRTREDSNLWPLPSEGSALSS